MPKISDELRERFSAHANDSNHLEVVIVTLRTGAQAEQLQQAGMRISNTMRNLPIVTGMIDVATLNKLSVMNEVVRVEPDDTMHALDT